MSAQEDYLFWRLAHYFISNQQYRIVQLSENAKELWLERLDFKQAQLIRLLRYNLDWSNWLQRDIEMTAANGEKIRKQLGRRHLRIMNIYISAFPPVDDYQFRLEKPYTRPNSNRTEVTTLLFERSSINDSFHQLGSYFHDSIPFNLKEDYTENDIELKKTEALSAAERNLKTEKALFNFGKPFFTYVFITLQIAAFLLLEANGGSTNSATLIQFGAKYNPLIREGEWWRFFTPILLHIGILHLLMNTLALYYLGTLVERIYGNFRFLLIYLFAGFSGTLASFVFSQGLSAGASGAIFGGFGALLYFGTIFPKLFFRTMGTNIILVIGINLVFGLSVPGIDNAGHIGGLIGGFLAAGILHFPRKKKLLLQLIFLLLTVVAVSGFLRYGFGDTNKNEQYTLSIGHQYIFKKINGSGESADGA